MTNSNMTLFVDGIIFSEQIQGGISRIWDEVLPRLQKNGVSVNLLLPATTKRNSLSILRMTEGIKIQRDFFYWPKRFFERNEIRSKLLLDLYKARNSRIFHSTYFTTIYSHDIAKFVTIPDLIYELYANQSSSKWEKQVLRNKEESIRNADKIIVISENTKKDLLRFYPGVSEDKIAVIYLGVTNLSSLANGELTYVKECNRKLHLRDQDYFLLVGRIDGYKNFQLILNMMRQHPAARRFKYLSVGSGKKSPSRIRAEKEFPDNFIFLDNVSNLDLAFYYRNAIGLVHPSLYEGFGLTILEAMSNHCPVICSDSSSLPEVGGDAALYFDPHSSDELFGRMTDVLICDRERVIEKGLENCAKFSWDLTAKALLHLYQEFQ